jgi:pilus assembly protein CpaB
MIFGIVLILGVGLAGFAVYTVKQYLGEQQARVAELNAAAATAIKTVDVFVAARDIKYGEKITLADLRSVPYA